MEIMEILSIGTSKHFLKFLERPDTQLRFMVNPILRVSLKDLMTGKYYLGRDYIIILI